MPGSYRLREMPLAQYCVIPFAVCAFSKVIESLAIELGLVNWTFFSASPNLLHSALSACILRLMCQKIHYFALLRTANMNRLAVMVICAFGLAGSLKAWPAPGMIAPEFALDGSLTGPADSIRLSALLGEVVYINFFGATCPICQSDGWLSEQIYDTFATNSEVNIFGIDVWNGPAFYLNGTFRTLTGITYPLLINGRTTGYAYDMENEPVPSPTDNEGRGHIVIDQQGVIQYYQNYNDFDETHRDEIIATIRALLFDPCDGITELETPIGAAMVFSEVGLKFCWTPVPCATRYIVTRSLTGDFSDEEIVDIVTGNITVIDPQDEFAVFRVIAERESEQVSE